MYRPVFQRTPKFPRMNLRSDAYGLLFKSVAEKHVICCIGFVGQLEKRLRCSTTVCQKPCNCRLTEDLRAAFGAVAMPLASVPAPA